MIPCAVIEGGGGLRYHWCHWCHKVYFSSPPAISGGWIYDETCEGTARQIAQVSVRGVGGWGRDGGVRVTLCCSHRPSISHYCGIERGRAWARFACLTVAV